MVSVLHRCPYCSYETDLSGALPAFTENPHCQRCGLSAAEGDMKMDNDLAALFASKMAVTNAPIQQTTVNVPPSQASNPASPLFSNNAAATSSQSNASTDTDLDVMQQGHSNTPNPIPGAASVFSPEDTLRSYNIDPNSLYPSQIALFSQAAPEQKFRLIELWRISPGSAMPNILPSQGAHIVHTNFLSNLANTVNKSQCGTDDMMMDDEKMDAEPYVLSGYERLAQQEYESQSAPASTSPLSTQTYNQATDPVYKGSEWQQQQQEQQQCLMENQYGELQMKKYYFGCGISRAHWLEDEQML
ncbi:hypothetical protein MGYG_04775 [Nannizzia gypsea CBS 118893]|uniref:Uncharacterized protein n=1 Tax=Arthroderma gypseum (strain ATCC MYA-4604 / CBS 118893) TaxID=535722 RepID=E4UWS0_ARTGP|nr:hypothetical protein MGYG_04775 [Nannizzia gypsea CBS 118893]EFR01773.1 hypothetical protein MGYG_04775 [Nannizzia gypsea CBS 118893]